MFKTVERRGVAGKLRQVNPRSLDGFHRFSPSRRDLPALFL
jgi:hypothetical protein